MRIVAATGGRQTVDGRQRVMTGRAGTLAAAAIAVMAVARAPGAAPSLIWNVTASVPTGLYRIRPVSHPVAGMLVVAWPPEPLAAVLAERRYLPRGVPLIKPVLAVAGQTVCRAGLLITVDGHGAGAARERDHHGRLLPAWQGCRVIGGGEVFLMTPGEPASLDGRYFGPLPVSAIAGIAAPVLIAADDRP